MSNVFCLEPTLYFWDFPRSTFKLLSLSILGDLFRDKRYKLALSKQSLGTTDLIFEYGVLKNYYVMTAEAYCDNTY